MTSITTLFKTFYANLLFTNTVEDAYKNFFKHKHLFDFSKFSKDCKFYDKQNEIVAGKMKDEYKEIPIHKFVRLKSKMNCMLSDNGKKSNKAKGVNIEMKLKEYEAILFNKKVIRQIIRRLQSKNHKTLYT